MNIQGLLGQVVSGKEQLKSSGQAKGFMGGAAAGGVMALLVGNKKARKFAGKAATVGGAAVLGGLAFAAMRNWQQSKQTVVASQSSFKATTPAAIPSKSVVDQSQEFSQSFELLIVKVMISAAHADGHIDTEEQQRIFDAVEQMSLSEGVKGMLMDLIRYPDSPEQLAKDAHELEQKMEVYLMACFAIDIDTPEERTYLNHLAKALELPQDLPEHLEAQAKELDLKAA